MSKYLVILALTFTLLLSACGGGSSLQAEADAVSTIVAATVMANNNAQPTATPLPLVAANGSVEGTICFPSSGIPPMNLYLHQVGADTPNVLSINTNQMSFSAELTPGTYVAYAWLPDFSLGGSYSQAVACGLSVECTDHSLVQFQVAAGALTSGVDVCDWYGSPGDVPLPSGAQGPSDITSAGGTGSLSGNLSYPSNFIPSMAVVAWDMSNPGVYYYIITAEGSSTYVIPDLPAGDYQVVAYIDSLSAGYSFAVPCGLSVDCTDHSLINVSVTAGQDTGGVNPQDWYAPQGAFPSNPLQ